MRISDWSSECALPISAIYRDSDTVLAPAIVAALVAADVPIFEYGGGLNTEQAIFSTASDALVQELLVYARAERGDDAVDNNIDIKIDRKSTRLNSSH